MVRQLNGWRRMSQKVEKKSRTKIVYVFSCPFCQYSYYTDKFIDAIAHAENHIKMHKYSRYDVTKNIKHYFVVENQ